MDEGDTQGGGPEERSRLARDRDGGGFDLTRFRRAPTTLWRNVGDEVLVGLPTGDGFEVLAGTAGHVWRLLAEQPTFEQLTDLFDGIYDAPREVIAADLAALLEELRCRGFVEGVATGGG